MKCKYKCMGCGFFWANYRVWRHRCGLADPENVHPVTGEPFQYMGQCPDNCKKEGQIEKFRGPGMTECPRCGNIHVEWVNAKAFLESLGEYWKS